MTNCYSLSFPKLPEILNQSLLQYAYDNKDLLGTDVINIKEVSQEKLTFNSFHRETNTNTTSYFIIPLSEDLKKEIHSFLGNVLFPHSTVNYYLHYIVGDSKFVPHRDPGRTCCFLYNLTDDNATTYWFKSKNNDKRIMYLLEELELVESFKLEKNKWYLLNTDEIHAVFDMRCIRIGLTCNLSADCAHIRSFESFVKDYSNLLVAGAGFEPAVSSL